MYVLLLKRKISMAEWDDTVYLFTQGNEQSEKDVEKMVEKKLAEKEADVTKATYEAVTQEFLAAHPEFSQENDPGGIKLSAFQKAVLTVCCC